MGVDWKRPGSVCWNAALTSHRATGGHEGSVSIASMRTPAERLRNQEDIFKTLRHSHGDTASKKAKRKDLSQFIKILTAT